MPETPKADSIEPGAFLMCDGCGQPTPFAPSREEIRFLAGQQGWAVDVGDMSEDFCPGCKP